MSAEPALKLHDVSPATDGAALAAASASAPASPEPRPGQLIDAAGVRDLLAVSRATFTRLKAGNKIGPAPIRAGGSLRYSLEEVVCWLRHRRPNGELHDHTTWGACWAAMNKRTR